MTVRKNIMFENSTNRDSEEPGTEYTIAYYMGKELRFIKITSQSAFKALKIFQQLHDITYKKASIKEVK